MDIMRGLEVLGKYKRLGEEVGKGRLEEISRFIKLFDYPEGTRDLVAIDGSHTFVLHLAGLWLALIRVGALHYEFRGDYKMKELYPEESTVAISPHEGFTKDQDGLYRAILERGKRQGNLHTYMVGEFRRLAELRMAGRMAEKLSNTIIALDGPLATPPLEEFSSTMEKALEACRRNRNTLVGVSKDSNTHSLDSLFSDGELLARLENGAGLCYLPVALKKAEPICLHGEVYFARLYPGAKRWFRVDIGVPKGEPEGVFPQLASYARSALCPGYPYPLLEAHRYAVEVRRMEEVYDRILTDLGPRYGITPEEILQGRTDAEGGSKALFHRDLDLLSR